MSSIVVTRQAPAPVEVIKQALAWARIEGYQIAPGAWGIHCVSGEPPRWERDPRSATIDPLACVVLMLQPEAMHLPFAAAEALGVTVAWAEGCSYGLDGKPLPRGWAESPARLMAQHGHETGLTLRPYLSGRGFGLETPSQKGMV